MNTNIDEQFIPGLESQQTVNSRIRNPKSPRPSHVLQVDVALLERLFNRSADVAFFAKDDTGRYAAVNDSLVERHGLKSKSQAIGNCLRWVAKRSATMEYRPERGGNVHFA